MAYIVGESSDKLTVEPTGKCIRSSLYGNEGKAIAQGFPYSPSEVARGAVVWIYDTAGSIVAAQAPLWALRNSSASRYILIHAIHLQGYGVSGGTGTNLRLQINTFKNVTSITGTGAVTLTPSIFKTSLGQATAIDAKVSNAVNALILNGNIATGEGIGFRPFGLFPSATVQVALPQALYQGRHGFPVREPIRLDENEVAALVSNFTLVSSGVSFMGSAFFTEHAV